MKYVKWLLLAVIDVLFNIIAYFTNPLILLFADELGNLPGWALWWANWDDHLDVEWMISEHHVPKWAEYDFNKHYRYYSEWEAEKTIGEHRGYVVLLDPSFTLWERFQRYICRLVWLYRNCAYGFSYYVTGLDVNGAEVKEIKTYAKDGYMFKTSDNAWVLRYNGKSFAKNHNWKIFLGWKMQSVDPEKTERCMLAFCINPWK